MFNNPKFYMVLTLHSFDVLQTVHLSIILAVDQLNIQILVLQEVCYIPVHVSSTTVLETCTGM